MNPQCTKPASISALAATQEFADRRSAMENEQLALPLTISELKASGKQLDRLHPGNRLRLMFGQPLLPQEPASGQSR